MHTEKRKAQGMRVCVRLWMVFLIVLASTGYSYLDALHGIQAGAVGGGVFIMAVWTWGLSFVVFHVLTGAGVE